MFLECKGLLIVISSPSLSPPSAAPDQLQSPRQLSASTSFGSPDKQLQQQRILAAADPLPGMTTSVTRNVRGQVVVPPKSPARGLSSGLPSHSSGQLSASQMRQSQSSYSNDSSRYMDPTKSRRAAWGPSTGTSSALVASAGAGPETTARSTSTMHTKTMYGSSSAWLMGFRCDTLCATALDLLPDEHDWFTR